MVDALKILSIAGSDNTSGAGIQADIKTSQYLDIYCLSVVTAITSQNSEKILKVFTIPENILASQLKITLQEYKVDAVKVGLVNNLATAEMLKILEQANLNSCTEILELERLENRLLNNLQIIIIKTN